MNPKSTQLDRPFQRIAASIDFQSIIFEKTSPEERRRIDEAIIHRKPATYRGAYDHFILREKGVSFTAFYHYARRLRIQAALIEHARLLIDDGFDVRERLPEILAVRLMEAALDETTSARSLERLASAYRMAAKINFDGEKLATQMADVVRDRPDLAEGPFNTMRREAGRVQRILDEQAEAEEREAEEREAADREESEREATEEHGAVEQEEAKRCGTGVPPVKDTDNGHPGRSEPDTVCAHARDEEVAGPPDEHSKISPSSHKPSNETTPARPIPQAMARRPQRDHVVPRSHARYVGLHVRSSPAEPQNLAPAGRQNVAPGGAKRHPGLGSE